MSGYVINVSLNGVHFFATRESSLFGPRLKMLIGAMKVGFPESKGYKVSVTYWQNTGKEIDPASIGEDDLTLEDFERGYILGWAFSFESKGILQVGEEFVLHTGDILICKKIIYNKNKSDVVEAETKCGKRVVIPVDSTTSIHRHKLFL